MPDFETGNGQQRFDASIAAEVALLLPVAFAPLALGTVHDVPLWIACGLAVAAFAVAAWACFRSGEPFELPLPVLAFAGVALVIALQLLPLPPILIGLLSPRAKEIFSFVLGDAGSGWRPISLNPPATARELAKALAGTLVVAAACQVARSRRARGRLTLAVGLLALLVALIGFVHELLGATSLFGVYAWSFRPTLLTTFANPNHLAAFLALGATLLLARVLSERDPAADDALRLRLPLHRRGGAADALARRHRLLPLRAGSPRRGAASPRR